MSGISRQDQLTYVNDASKIIYDNNSIVSNYIHWSNSKTYICTEGKFIFFHVEHINDDLIVNIHSSAAKGIHSRISKLLEVSFQVK